MDEGQFSRREFFRLLGGGALTIYLQGCASLEERATRRPASTDFLGAFGPIDRSPTLPSPNRFSGDNFERPHRLLWDLPAYFAQHPIPPPEGEVPVVIVGGGLSGLFTAYLLRDYQPILLEQAPRFGGNAKAEGWEGIDYALGAAYFNRPEAGSVLGRLYDELGITGQYRIKSSEDPIAVAGHIQSGFWDGLGVATGAQSATIKKVGNYLRDVLANRHGYAYPQIPSPDAASRKIVDSLDQEDFHSHLVAAAGGPLPDPLLAAVEHYCWSAFAASSREVSSAAGLNFLAAEFGEIAITPGGNAGVAETVLQRVLDSASEDRLRPGSIVLRVSADASGSTVVYESPDSRLHTIRARAVVMACPKFIVAKILDGIEPQRWERIRSLTYRSYLVANVLLRRPMQSTFYDLYLLGTGKPDLHNIRESADQQKATDVIAATYATSSRRASVLTLYRALPYDGGRMEVFQANAHERFRREFENQIYETILPITGFNSADVAQLRLTRWGHPLPVPKTGVYRNGVVESLRKPFRERVFFVEQDNWLLPALETTALEALRISGEIKELLGSSLS